MARRYTIKQATVCDPRETDGDGRTDGHLLVNPPKFSPPGTDVGPYHPFRHGLEPSTVLEVETYSGGGKVVKWPLEGPDRLPEPDFDDGLDPARRDLEKFVRPSLEQSRKSRIRAAWTLGNSRSPFRAMSTLTFPADEAPSDYEELRRMRTGFLKRAMKAYPKSGYGWILEFTKKGTPHFHVFWTGEIVDAMNESEIVTRRGHDGGDPIPTEIVRGKVDARIQTWWRNQTRIESEEFLRFQAGGITEILRSPEGAARYVAKEAAKRCQKISPFPVSQWWGMSNDLRPRKVRSHFITVSDYLDLYGDVMMARIFGNVSDDISSRPDTDKSDVFRLRR
ncbi:MAG: hypothetical protein AAFY15_01830 [Cyanobacteria bacterium J06648_11]